MQCAVVFFLSNEDFFNTIKKNKKVILYHSIGKAQSLIKDLKGAINNDGDKQKAELQEIYDKKNSSSSFRHIK